MNDRWSLPILAVVCTAVGIASGYFAAMPAASATADDAAHPPDEDVHFDKATLATLGVTLGPTRTTTFIRETRIAATTESMPLTERAIYAPIGGRVETIKTRPGAVLASGAPVMTILREPVPLPELRLTVDAAQPAHEEIHNALRALRTAAADVDITRQELERLEDWVNQQQTVVPRQRLIDLNYELRRAEVSLALAAHDLERHGFATDKIAELTKGGDLPPFDASNVQRTLRHYGLWPPAAQRLADALPVGMRSLSLAIATIGELAGHGMIDDDLLEWIENDEAVGRGILLVGSLLLQGRSLAEVRAIHDAGGLAPDFSARAPDDAPDWDVVAISVQPGAQIRAGDRLAVVRDSRRLRLRITPIGGEVATVLDAIQHRSTCRAVPLIAGTGVAIEDVRVRYATDAENHLGTVAYAEVDNLLLTAGDADGPRTWALRPDVRYELRVPSTRIEDALVLPKVAVATVGATRVVFRPQTAQSFTEIPVAIVHEDDEVVVLLAAANPEVAGRTIVMAGAFDLALAMHASNQPAEHSHDH